ncbi:uncharacterized protein FFM5_15127 [Fusarium fujikuroi]
MKRLA